MSQFARSVVAPILIGVLTVIAEGRGAEDVGKAASDRNREASLKIISPNDESGVGGWTDGELSRPATKAANPAAAPYIVAILVNDPLCMYHAAPGGMASTSVSIWNYGTSGLQVSGAVTAGGSWLSISGGPLSIPPGPNPALMPVTMNATTLSPGIYNGEIQVTHDDISQISPIVLKVEFHVDAGFICSERVNLHTAVTSPGVLSLTVESAGRYGFGDQVGDDGMLRPADSSESIFDGSLVLAHGSVMPDTTVYFSFYGNSGNPGFRGFVATSAMVIDTTAYGTGTGNATAEYQFRTDDGVLRVDGKWFFPQDPDSADFILSRYIVTNMSAGPISDMLVGEWCDFDVVPGTQFRYLQEAVNNHSADIPADNLVYQYGYTKIGTTPMPPLLLAERYSAGMAYLAGRDYAGTGLPFVDQQVSFRGGTRDFRESSSRFFGDTFEEYLYSTLSGPASVSLWEGFPHADSSSDAVTFITLDQGLSLTPGQSQMYVVVFMSDTLSNPAMALTKGASPADLSSTAEKAAAWAQNHNVYDLCACDCHADPVCDGVRSNVQDVVATISVAFRGAAAIADPDGACPYKATDMNCDTFTSVIDVVKVVNVSFRGANPATEFCNPCP